MHGDVITASLSENAICCFGSLMVLCDVPLDRLDVLVFEILTGNLFEEVRLEDERLVVDPWCHVDYLVFLRDQFYSFCSEVADVGEGLGFIPELVAEWS